MKNPYRNVSIAEKVQTSYVLSVHGSDVIIPDDGFLLAHPDYPDRLLRAEYEEAVLHVGDDSLGFYKFADWLPVNHFLSGSSAPVTYLSRGLAKALGMHHLYITFSGYWPERNAYMLTGTFKECEAFAVCGRLPEDFNEILVVASAGNTARAFARVCSENNIPLLLVVPHHRRHKLWFGEEIHPCVKLVTVAGNSDYYDAIRIADAVAAMPGFVAEGGARNVARRDGMGTTVLSAVTTIGAIPDYYFQAVGSGTGAIAAWEANLRFIKSKRYGNKKMSLQVAQNAPFTPMYDAWKKGSRELLPLDENMAKLWLSQIYADVLANRKPPYGVEGGLYDALMDSGGDMHAISNEEAMEAGKLFQETEGIDVEPAAAVATAALVRCVKEGRIRKNDLVMLNITGGGIERFKRTHQIVNLEPALVLDVDQYNPEEDIPRIVSLFSN